MKSDQSNPMSFSSQENDDTVHLLSRTAIIKPREIHYQVIDNLEDIKDCLRLRYVSYRYVNFIEENKDRLDIDPYDLYSTFLGAYDVTDKRRILVGTLRIISADEHNENTPHIRELISTARDPLIREMRERPAMFPIMESFALPDSCLKYFKSDKNNNDLIHPYEISRLAVRPDYWMHNIDVGLHHLFVLDSWLHNPPRNDFLIAVHPRSRRRYERVGFKCIPGTNEVLYKHINQLAIAMILDLKAYLETPRSYKEICNALLPHYTENHYFSRITERRQIERRIRERRKQERRRESDRRRKTDMKP